MINNFIKLDKSSETVLMLILKNNVFPMELTDECWDKSQIETLINYKYLYQDTKAETNDIIGGWHCWIIPTYEGKNYNKIKKEYYFERVMEELKFIIPLIVSIIALII